LRKQTVKEIILKREIEDRQKCNQGYAVIINDSEEITSQMKEWFPKILQAYYDTEVGIDLNMIDWVLEQAPLHNNIMWENFFQHQDFYMKLKAFATNFFILLVATSLATPQFFI